MNTPTPKNNPTILSSLQIFFLSILAIFFSKKMINFFLSNHPWEKKILNLTLALIIFTFLKYLYTKRKFPYGR